MPQFGGQPRAPVEGVEITAFAVHLCGAEGDCGVLLQSGEEAVMNTSEKRNSPVAASNAAEGIHTPSLPLAISIVSIGDFLPSHATS
jgi:hypothetical protein